MVCVRSHTRALRRAGKGGGGVAGGDDGGGGCKTAGGSAGKGQVRRGSTALAHACCAWRLNHTRTLLSGVAACRARRNVQQALKVRRAFAAAGPLPHAVSEGGPAGVVPAGFVRVCPLRKLQPAAVALTRLCRVRVHLHGRLRGKCEKGETSRARGEPLAPPPSQPPGRCSSRSGGLSTETLARSGDRRLVARQLRRAAEQ